MLVPPNAFTIDALVLPTMKFLERAKTALPDGMVTLDYPPTAAGQQGAERAGKRFSSVIDDETMERLGPAIEAYVKRNGVAVNGS